MDSGRHQVEGMLQSLAQLAGAELDLSGAYPGWKPDADSEIMHIFRDMYEGIYGHKPNIMVIHAGLECGLFKNPIQTWIWSLSVQPSSSHIHRMKK